jgi:hypothetical protein
MVRSDCAYKESSPRSRAIKNGALPCEFTCPVHSVCRCGYRQVRQPIDVMNNIAKVRNDGAQNLARIRNSVSGDN